jgi:hypothetical protein
LAPVGAVARAHVDQPGLGRGAQKRVQSPQRHPDCLRCGALRDALRAIQMAEQAKELVLLFGNGFGSRGLHQWFIAICSRVNVSHVFGARKSPELSAMLWVLRFRNENRAKLARFLGLNGPKVGFDAGARQA